MKKLASLLTVAALIFTLTAPALAHDGWSQTNAPIISQGEVSYVELMLGNHSNHHASYRIAGKWSPESSKVYVVSPSGVKADITDTLFYSGEVKEVEQPSNDNFFVASFSASNPGAYIVSVEGDSIFKGAEVASRTLRSAKSFVAVSDIPTVERVKPLKGFGKAISTDRAELVPQFNPAAITPDQQVAVQLLLKGKPLANTEVTIIRRSTSDSQIVKTDANGVISFTTGPADYYLLRAKPATDEKEAGKYDTTNYEATMTFTVQNGKSLLPKAVQTKSPVLYVNGKPITDVKTENKNGKLTVSAAFVKTYVNPNFAGTGNVELRSAVEGLGGTVEYLAPVGAVEPALLVYTAKK
ncbi:MAG: DUF4198 domain-containing protein [Clostridia bacterium]